MQPTNATYGGCSLLFEKRPVLAMREIHVGQMGRILADTGWFLGSLNLNALSPVHTKPTVGHRAVFVRRLTKFSQCVPRRWLKLVLVSFFRTIRHVESASELVGQLGHLIILIGCSAGEPVHEKGAERTCYLAIGCRASAWCVRETLDRDAADDGWLCKFVGLFLWLCIMRFVYIEVCLVSLWSLLDLLKLI